jgi:hypothetical protein
MAPGRAETRRVLAVSPRFISTVALSPLTYDSCVLASNGPAGLSIR